MKKKFLLSYDYETGAGFAYVYAESISEIKKVFPEKCVTVIDADEENEPDMPYKKRRLVTDIDNLSGWLKKIKEHKDKKGNS